MSSPQKLKSGLLSHFLAFAFGAVFFTVQSGAPPSWMLWWGLGLALHSVSTFAKLKMLKGEAAPELEAQVEQVAQVQDSVERSLIEDVQEALSELEMAWQGQEALRGYAPDFPKLCETADTLNERHQALQELCSRAEGLPEQVQGLRTRLADNPSETEASALERELDALLNRVASHQAAQAVVRQLESELRTLLHRAEALRLDVMHSSVDVPELDTRAKEIRAQLDAAAEIDEHLARARRSARASVKR